MWNTADTDNSLYLAEGSWRHITFLISLFTFIREVRRLLCSHDGQATECSWCHCMVWKQMFRAVPQLWTRRNEVHVSTGILLTAVSLGCMMYPWYHIKNQWEAQQQYNQGHWHIFPGMQSSQPVTVMSCCLNGNQSEKGWKTPATLGYGYGQPHVLQHVAFITLIIKYLPHMLLLATCFMMSLKVYKLKRVVVYPPARETFPKVLQILKLQLFITFCLNDVTVTRLEEEQQQSSMLHAGMQNRRSGQLSPLLSLLSLSIVMVSDEPYFFCYGFGLSLCFVPFLVYLTSHRLSPRLLVSPGPR